MSPAFAGLLYFYKVRYLLFILISCFISGAIAQSAQQLTAVVFYNTENLFDTDNDPNKDDDEFTPGGAFHYTPDIYRQKLHNIAVVLKQVGFDKAAEGAALIGLAEVENDKVLIDLINQPEIKSRNYRYIWFDSPDVRGIDVALLYQPGYFKPLFKKAITVPLTVNGVDQPTRDVLYVRGVLIGDTVNILVNHWPSRRDGVKETAPRRAVAATINRKIIDSLFQKNPGSKIIVMGDLNDNPNDESITRVLDVTFDKEKVSANSLYDPWMDMYKQGLGTTSFKKKYDLFDQVIVSGAFLQHRKLSFHSAEIFNKDFLKTKTGKYAGLPYRSFHGPYWIGGYSDHFPVIVYLQKGN